MRPLKSLERRFTERIIVRSPPTLVAAIKRAADKLLMTESEYVRRSIVAQLQRDGERPT
jgi:hypothetical protein